MSKLVCGVGLNDADYPVQPEINGKQIKCPFYRVWESMLNRCYSRKYQANKPTYTNCTVYDEWLKFSNFKSWMEQQDWQDKQLDKDLIFAGNKIYSPDKCVFVDRVTNTFVIDSGASRGEWPIGVNFFKPNGKFIARCCNPFTKKRESLGYFACPEQAHQAWKTRKHELALQLAEIQSDPRVAAALKTRYL